MHLVESVFGNNAIVQRLIAELTTLLTVILVVDSRSCCQRGKIARSRFVLGRCNIHGGQRGSMNHAMTPVGPKDNGPDDGSLQNVLLVVARGVAKNLLRVQDRGLGMEAPFGVQG